MTEDRDFKGVWIPKELWLSKDLSPMEKFFLLEIDSLDNDKGCYASNAHFSELFDLSKPRCTEIIKNIEKKGYISISLEYKGKQIKKRTIILINQIDGSKKYKQGGIRKTEQGGIRKTEQGYSENTKGNNTKEQYKRSLCQRKKFSDDDLKLAQFIFRKVQEINPKEKTPNFDKWANSIRIFRERDERTHKEIQDIFIWANNDPFWSVNIRSPGKLRKQFTKLEDTKRLGVTNEKNRQHHKSGNYQELEESNRRNFEKIQQLDREIEELEIREGISQTLDDSTEYLPEPGI